MTKEVMLFGKCLENIVRLRLQEQGCTNIVTNVYDYFIDIYISKERYLMYFADGIFYANDKDIAGEFDYYVGNKVMITSSNGFDYEFQPNNTKVEWNAIRYTEGILRLAYIHTMSILYKGKLNTAWMDTLTHHYITEQGIDTLQKVMENHLVKIFQVHNNEGKDQEYEIHAYPDYSDNEGSNALVYIQIGYPEREDIDYPLCCDNLLFFLSVNMRSGECFISTDFPWVSPQKNLFDARPQQPTDDWFTIDVWTAIKIMAYNTMMTISKGITPQEFFTERSDLIGLESNPKKVDTFARKLLDKFILEFPLSKKGEIYRQTIQFISYPNGITRFYVGIFVLDIAIDTCGLVDVGLILNMGTGDSWDIIWKTSYTPTTDDNEYCPLQKNKKVICYDTMTTESRVVVEEASKIVQSMMFQIDEIVLAQKEGL